MSGFVEVRIGAKFGAEDDFGNAKVAGRASWCAGNIAQCIANNPLPEDISTSMKNHILNYCAVLIVSLARISICTCKEQPCPDYIVPSDCESLADYAEELLLSISGILEFVAIIDSHDEETEGLEREIWDSIFTTCKIAAALDVTDLEPYIASAL